MVDGRVIRSFVHFDESKENIPDIQDRDQVTWPDRKEGILLIREHFP